MKKFVNEFQRIQNPVPDAPYLCPVNVLGYNEITIVNNTATPIAWANEYNTILGYQYKVVYRGNENEICSGILNVFLPEKIIGFPASECTVIKKRFL